MSSYLHSVFEQEKEQLDLKYREHFLAFQKTEQEKILSARRKEEAKTLADLESLEKKEDDLKKKQEFYDKLLSQHEEKRQVVDTTQSLLNQVIQQINGQRGQINHVAQNINQSIELVNMKQHQLSDKEERERALSHFYNNEEYRQESTVVLLEEDFRTWIIAQNAELSFKVTDYNNKTIEFNNWSEEQKKIIDQQIAQVNTLKEELDHFTEATNQLITIYNRLTQKECKTSTCLNRLLAKQNEIRQRRVEKEQRELAIEDLSKDIIQKEIDYDIEHKTHQENLNTLDQEIKTFYQGILTEKNHKEHEIKERIQEQSVQALTRWDRSRKELELFQAELNADYGGNFKQFVDHFSTWVIISQSLFDEVLSMRQLEIDKLEDSSLQKKGLTEGFDPRFFSQQIDQALAFKGQICPNDKLAYSEDREAFLTDISFQVNPHTDTKVSSQRDTQVSSQTNSQAICRLIAQVHTLFNNILSTYFNFKEKGEILSQQKEEINKLVNQIREQAKENERLTAQLNRHTEQYNQQTSRWQVQYNRAFNSFNPEWDLKLKKLKTAYELKGKLLLAEYNLLNYLLFTVDEDKQQDFLNQTGFTEDDLVVFPSMDPEAMDPEAMDPENLNQTSINKKWSNFRSAREEFLSNIPEGVSGFPDGFSDPYKIISIVFQEGACFLDTEVGIAFNTEVGITSNTEVGIAFNTEVGIASNTEVDIPSNTEVKPSSSSYINSRTKLVEGERKKQIVFLWMQTDLVSDFLANKTNRVRGIFSDYESTQSSKVSLKSQSQKSDECSASYSDDGKNVQAFLEILFLESVSSMIPIRRVIPQPDDFSIPYKADHLGQGQLMVNRYQAVFDNRWFWILPDGKWQPPKGFYQ